MLMIFLCPPCMFFFSLLAAWRLMRQDGGINILNILNNYAPKHGNIWTEAGGFTDHLENSEGKKHSFVI